jgi:hypothetical protein
MPGGFRHAGVYLESIALVDRLVRTMNILPTHNYLHHKPNRERIGLNAHRTPEGRWRITLLAT